MINIIPNHDNYTNCLICDSHSKLQDIIFLKAQGNYKVVFTLCGKCRRELIERIEETAYDL